MSESRRIIHRVRRDQRRLNQAKRRADREHARILALLAIINAMLDNGGIYGNPNR